MGIEEYSLTLQMFSQQSYFTNYLEYGSKAMLIEKARSLAIDSRGRRRGTPAKWGIVIPLENPLVFIRSSVDGLELQVDIACEIEGHGDEITKHNIVLRIWSLDKEICYREDVDASELETKLEEAGRRVMLRFHFDLRDPKTEKPEPLYHLQVGGNPRDDENCWLHKRIQVPRFHYPPMDIVLLCELVLVNFFPQQSEDLRKRPEWRSLVRKSQDMFQKDYLNKCKECINKGDDTLLGHLVTLS